MRGLAFAVAVVAVACAHPPPRGGATTTDRSPAPTCASTVVTMLDAAQAYDPPHNNWTDETKGNLRAVLVNRCIEDHWASAAQTCLAAVRTRADLNDCWEKQLTADQRAKADRVARAVANVSTRDSADDERELPMPRSSATADSGEAMRVSRDFTERICTCADHHDQDCFKKVQDDMQKWVAQNADKMKDFRPSDAEQQQMQVIAQRMSGCMQKLMADSMGGSAAP